MAQAITPHSLDPGLTFRPSPRRALGLTRRLLLALLLALLLNSALNVHAFPKIAGLRGSLLGSGTVIAVYDGDTVKVRFSNGSEELVRLIGVDSPEIDDPKEELSYRAHLAQRFSFFHLYRKKITLSYDRMLRDKHGRILAYVWDSGQTLFNETILREGFARAFFAFPFRGDYQERFRKAEEEARRDGRGLWFEGKPEVIPSASVASRIGRIISVRFICAEVRKSSSFIYLRSDDGLFEALIPRERQAFFPSPDTFLGQALMATGFLEEFRGRPQILVFFRHQLGDAQFAN